jgi:uncharacterized membrane protein
MRFLKGFVINLIIGLNAFIAFFLVFEHRIEIPSLLKVAGRIHPLFLHFPIVLLILTFVVVFFKNLIPIEKTAIEKITRLLLYSNAVFSGITVVLGLLLSQEDGYVGSNVLLYHKWTGVSLSFFATVLLSVGYVNWNEGILKGGLVVSVVVLTVASHFGATLTHGENFVMAPLVTKNSNTIDLNEARIYSDLVQPVLKEKCFRCHNPDKAKGELVMTDSASLRKGGKTGKLFLAGDSGKSLIIERLLLSIDHKHRMPPKGKPQLSEDEIAMISSWIKLGGSFTSKLSDFPANDKIHELAANLYSGNQKEIYEFPAADEALLKKLNNSYRVITTVAFDSPALDVSFFNRSVFNGKSLEALTPIKAQIVRLNLSGMRLREGDIKLIASFENLRQINLNYTNVTDENMAMFKILKKLDILMLTGTNVSSRGLAGVLSGSKPKHIYAWNTALNTKQGDSLMLKFPGVKIETGFQDDGMVVLDLNSPEILPGNAFFRQPFYLNIAHPIKGAGLYYTLDGTEPDSITSKLFREPVLITSNTPVKVKAAKKGWASSKVVQKYFQRSSILPDSFRLLTPPDPYHKGRGAETLFDLAEGSTDILYASDGKWLGYRNQAFEVELNFRKPVRISEIIFSTLLNVNSESFPPAEVEVWISKDRNAPVLFSKIRPDMPAKEAAVQQKLIPVQFNQNTTVTGMKIIAKPLGKLPKWHKNAGSPAWFFIDEILIN